MHHQSVMITWSGAWSHNHLMSQTYLNAATCTINDAKETKTDHKLRIDTER